jgi:hypothetical protein
MNLCHHKIYFDSTSNRITTLRPCLQIKIKLVSSFPDCFCGYHRIDVTKNQDPNVGRKTFVYNPFQLLVYTSAKYSNTIDICEYFHFVVFNICLHKCIWSHLTYLASYRRKKHENITRYVVMNMRELVENPPLSSAAVV